ncbi:hypothetical protein DLM75_21950 [Leptospira stimsonii]|uniref:Uncharacterized protein n=1 Tax=Leptospira stimsonii TaxID=2202203 RepID=A0A396YPM9_9LEPT|nr:hypothetical protein DLM75_21950 [Leptospira stimsonii]
MTKTPRSKITRIYILQKGFRFPNSLEWIHLRMNIKNRVELSDSVPSVLPGLAISRKMNILWTRAGIKK